MVLIISMSMIIAKIGDNDGHDNHDKRYDDDNKGYDDDDDDEVYLAKLGLNILWLGSKNHQRLSSVWIKIIILILMMKMVKIMIVMMKTVEIMIVMNFLLPK